MLVFPWSGLDNEAWKKSAKKYQSKTDKIETGKGKWFPHFEDFTQKENLYKTQKPSSDLGVNIDRLPCRSITRKRKKMKVLCVMWFSIHELNIFNYNDWYVKKMGRWSFIGDHSIWFI